MSHELEYTLEGPSSLEEPPETAEGLPIGSGLTGPDGAALAAKLDHCPEGLTRFLEVFKDKPRLETFLCIFLDQVQLAENALYELFTERTLDVAVGVQLDGLGDIVGQGRQDQTDGVYRRFIRVRILVNRSDGKLEQLYEIVILAMGNDPVVRIHEHYPAGMVVHVDTPLEDLTGLELFGILHDAKGGGVRLFLVHTYSPSDETFTWSMGDTAQDNGTGWGSTTNGAWGGDWASIIG